MGWHQTVDEADRREWERDDGFAVVRVRQTADGRWAVTLDRLEQAPGGPAYERETVGEEHAALSLAETWQREFDRGDATAES